ncbi:hypothetical protein VTO73DRAFT_12745 [Trametes versicolor]
MDRRRVGVSCALFNLHCDHRRPQPEPAHDALVPSLDTCCDDALPYPGILQRTSNAAVYFGSWPTCHAGPTLSTVVVSAGP